MDSMRFIWTVLIIVIVPVPSAAQTTASGTLSARIGEGVTGQAVGPVVEVRDVTSPQQRVSTTGLLRVGAYNDGVRTTGLVAVAGGARLRLGSFGLGLLVGTEGRRFGDGRMGGWAQLGLGASVASIHIRLAFEKWVLPDQTGISLSVGGPL